MSESVAEIAKGLSVGVKSILLNTNSVVRTTDWRVFRPKASAFEAARKLGLVRSSPKDGGWIVTARGLAVRDYLTQNREGQEG